VKALILALVISYSSAVAGGDTAAVPPAESALRAALFTRTLSNGDAYDAGELDILYWSNTRNLLTEPSHAKALAALDEFNQRNLARKIKDPLRRVILQRDLWQLYDWASENHEGPESPFERARAELRPRLAAAMKQLAPDEKQIARLPHNLNALGAMAGIADFPRGLLDDSGGWIMLGTSGGEAAAPVHAQAFAGHSTFCVLLRLPGGRTATLDYLQKLRDVLPRGDPALAKQHPETAFPPETLWALARVMNVIDVEGNIRSTQLVESLQMRRYKAVLPSSAPETVGNAQKQAQDTFELQLDRADLPNLRAVAAGELQLHSPRFMSMGFDLFEDPNVPSTSDTLAQAKDPQLRTCFTCHGAPGLISIRSYTGLFGPRSTPANVPIRFEREASITAAWKQQRADWQELRRLWGEASHKFTTP
jgi:hypothetical protein